VKKYIENQAEEEGSFKVWDVEPKEVIVKKTLGGLIRRLLAGFSLNSRIHAVKQSTGFSR
jgi:hypothetical protein